MRGPIIVPFTSKTWLLMERGMTGATGNFYCGLDDIDDLVTLHNIGIGDVEASLRFTATLDTMNHVATESDSESDTVEVPVIRMESLLRGLEPLCVKIDVEGFERKVIDGATSSCTYTQNERHSASNERLEGAVVSDNS